VKNINRRQVLVHGGVGTLAAIGGIGISKPARAEPIVMRLSHPLSGDSAIQKSSLMFGKRIEELTDNRYKLEVFSDSQLGTEARTMEGLQTGTIEFGASATSANVVPAARVFELPYVFRDFDHWTAVLKGEPGKMAAQSAEGTGVRVLGYWFAGWRDVYGREPIETVSDLSGAKIRTHQNPAFVELFKAIGAVPTPVAWPEVYLALQQGTVDAAETALSSVIDAKHYEVAKHAAVTRHASSNWGILMSDVKWASFPEDVQQAILTAEAEAGAYHNELMLEAEPKVIARLRDEGMEVVENFDASEMRKIAHEEVFPKIVTEDLQKEILALTQNL
jgi:TRAP-type transport system periplasmic protein